MKHNKLSSRIAGSWWLRHLLLGIAAFILIVLFVLYIIPASALSAYVHTRVEPENSFQPGEFGLTATPFEVTSQDNIVLQGEEFRAESPKGIVIMTGGLYNPTANALYGHAKLFLSNGYSVVIYSSRAHGESGGKLLGHGLTESSDINAVIDYVRSFTMYLNLPIILMGWNTGAAASINTAAVNRYVSGVIAVGSYANTHDYFMRFLENETAMPDTFLKISDRFLNAYLRITFKVDADEVSPDASVKNISCPISFITSTGDTFIDPGDSAKLLRVCQVPSTASLWNRDVGYSYVTGYFINLDKDEEYRDYLIHFAESIISAESDASNP